MVFTLMNKRNKSGLEEFLKEAKLWQSLAFNAQYCSGELITRWQGLASSLYFVFAWFWCYKEKEC